MRLNYNGHRWTAGELASYMSDEKSGEVLDVAAGTGLLGMAVSAPTRRLTNVGLMLAYRRRRWANIKPTLVERFETLTQCCANVDPPSDGIFLLFFLYIFTTYM